MRCSPASAERMAHAPCRGPAPAVRDVPDGAMVSAGAAARALTPLAARPGAGRDVFCRPILLKNSTRTARRFLRAEVDLADRPRIDDRNCATSGACGAVLRPGAEGLLAQQRQLIAHALRRLDGRVRTERLLCSSK
jgi:hypothetical protein